jgi:hypothetical protein
MRLFLLLLLVLSAAACPPFSVEDAAAGCVLCDCDGLCVDALALTDWPGDGVCNSAAPNLACSAFQWDGGDCSAPAREADVLLRENSFRGVGLALEIL